MNAGLNLMAYVAVVNTSIESQTWTDNGPNFFVYAKLDCSH